MSKQEELERKLELVFDAPPAELTLVVRQARDLFDSEQYEATHDHPLTVDLLIDNLKEAPAGSTLIDRWNWWIGALDLAHTGFAQFLIHNHTTDSTVD